MMLLSRSVAVAALAVCGVSAAPISSAASGSPDRDIRIEQPLQVDVAKLMQMKPGQQVVLELPRIGRQSITFETTTQGVDGLRYWHGRLGNDPRDRIYLKQTRKGLTGGVRFGGKVFALAQQGQGALGLAQTEAAVPSSSQAFTVGAASAPGVHPIASNFAALSSAEPGTEWALPLPGGQTEVVIVTRAALDEHGFQQISGISRLDGAAQSTQITVGPDAVFGTVHTVQGEYQIVTRQGRTEVLDPRAAGWSAPNGDDHQEAPADLLAAAAGATSVPAANAAAAGPLTAASGATAQTVPLKAGVVDTEINLLMSYSASLVSLWGSEASARTRLSNLVEVANQAYGNSGTGVRFKVVGWRQVRVADATPQVQLDALRRDAGAFAGTAAQKQAQGAAMTVFFAPFNATTGSTGTCGLAYVPAARAAGIDAYRQQAPSLMFAALNDGQHQSRYCESLTLAHELGHNLGAAHDKANSSFAGVFAYSYGKGVSGQFGTVMSYIQPKVALFSSPQLSCTSKKAPCGTSTENVVATFLQTKSTVAGLGRASAVAVGADGSVQAAGWVLQPNGTPYTAGGVTLTPTATNVSCTVGSTGLYNCRVPSGVNSVTLRAAIKVKGRSVTPAISTFNIDRMANTPVNATRFTVR